MCHSAPKDIFIIKPLYGIYRDKRGNKKNSLNKRKEIYRKRNKMGKMEERKIPDTEFKTMVIKMLKDLRGRMDDLSKKDSKH